jgi:acyl-CoA thioesterase
LKPTALNREELNRLMTTTSFNATLGFKVVRVWKDGITMEVQVRPELTNIFGSLHGGVTATLVDAAAGVALFGQLGGLRQITTVELKLNYLNPAGHGKVRARSRIIKLGKTLAVITVDVHDAHNRAVATALVTYMLL